MTNMPTFLKQGETARLFPVLSSTSKEGRATSILLSCFSKVHELSSHHIKTLGIKPGKRTKIQCYTEVVFISTSQKEMRPDGLIEINTGIQKKYFLLEAKIGNAVLNADQIENYMRICKEHKLAGVITISNQYSSNPTIHPLEEVRKIKLKVPVFHWSWMSILTTTDLLISNHAIKDHDQMLIANEFRRFLSHESTGVKGFDRMPSEWSEVNNVLSNQGKLTLRSDAARVVVESWQQEVKDLCLILSRLTNTTVIERLSITHARDPEARTKAGIKTLIEKSHLIAKFDIPDTAAPLDVVADITNRSIYIGMKIGAPQDKKSSKARLNWLLRQFKGKDTADVYVRVNWPGSSAPTSHKADDLIENPDLISVDKEHLTPISFMVFGSYRLAGRFVQVSNFISDLEKYVPQFYAQLGSGLNQWKPKAPTITERAEQVTVNSIAKSAEEF